MHYCTRVLICIVKLMNCRLTVLDLLREIEIRKTSYKFSRHLIIFYSKFRKCILTELNDVAEAKNWEKRFRLIFDPSRNQTGEKASKILKLYERRATQSIELPRSIVIDPFNRTSRQFHCDMFWSAIKSLLCCK